MSRLSKEFPEYGFEQNVGYGTKKHLEMLELYGPCDIHRMFYKPLLRFNT
jgi:ribonuclease HII